MMAEAEHACAGVKGGRLGPCSNPVSACICWLQVCGKVVRPEVEDNIFSR